MVEPTALRLLIPVLPIMMLYDESDLEERRKRSAHKKCKHHHLSSEPDDSDSLGDVDEGELKSRRHSKHHKCHRRSRDSDSSSYESDGEEEKAFKTSS
ncbi:hypothetical protein Tco_1175024 [Tanacetum coccineum]